MSDESQAASANREFAAKIVAAYARNNQIAADQMPALISSVYQAFAALGKPIAEPEAPRTPAVPVRRSAHRDYVVCLECGWRAQMLRRHLTTAHGLTVPEYRSRWNLPIDHPMTATGYSARRSTMAKQLGFGRGRASGETATVPETEAPAVPEVAAETTPQPTPKRRGRPRSRVTTAARA
jgi:predicted transcriptional regulator